MRPLNLAATTGTLLLLAACADRETMLLTAPPRNAPSRSVTSETSSESWQSIVTGETGPGSMYALYMPRAWNGTVVYYAHGIRNILLEPEVSLRDQDGYQAVRDALGARGYAFAYSSFDDNGYAEKDGAQRTHQLRGLFTSRFGAPQRSLLVGHSLGGLVALDLGERFSNQYDGVAAFCSVAGGTQAELDHMVNTRLLFDLYYPGVLEGAFNQIPPGYNIDPSRDPATLARIQAAINANPLGLLVIANTEQAGIEFVPAPAFTLKTMVQSVVTALVFHAAGYDNLLTLTNGKFPFDNSQTSYRAVANVVVPPPLNTFIPPQAITAQIAGIDARAPLSTGDPSALQYAAKYFTPSGALQIPTLTLHNRFDPLVPYWHETMFAERVSNAGALDRLQQRVNPGYGHCSFSTDEQVKAITDLAQWVETGVKP